MSRVLLDACVLYPTVLREILMGAADRGFFTPVWSARILEEWARAAARLGANGEAVARGEIALLRAVHPEAEVTYSFDLQREIELPDADDAHVLAAAVAGGADELLTFNLRDFPGRVLAGYGILPRGPDEFLLELFHNEAGFIEVLEAVRVRTEKISGREQPMRALLKRLRLPRLGKAVG
ncbi:RSP_2648 family PIN domain-containing protein [Algicella marina]|uniref:PIN domain-containing protein n=1 Tax=Algicella marina TaxID=2683284 RepID=A0A6P1SVI9_9RHOB|nr:PIN domain-containing protein [Algicella marina]QHQ34468.1 PIN domain-containing protein [Algicella marina]